MYRAYLALQDSSQKWKQYLKQWDWAKTVFKEWNLYVIVAAKILPDVLVEQNYRRTLFKSINMNVRVNTKGLASVTDCI